MAVAISGCEHGGGLSTIDGERVDISGKVLLINYWAEWCKPCREEVPELNRFARATDGVLVLGVNYDRPPAGMVAKQARKMGIEFPLLADDPAPRWKQPRPEVLPSTLVIGADGRWRETLVGPQTETSLTAAVERARGQ
ncbi:TlpA disulfide reductase family protein [Microbulbifer sp. SAOS-129_SWC]|uniref:TlpA family protein disulfide reductase n=1 Tax=Microbulbifer sp. SAOS-129_SWC TaxID=3145235 RepID=UPI00321744A5